MAIEDLTGVERLRAAKTYFDHLHESFNELFSVEELFAIWHYSMQHDDIPELADTWGWWDVETALAEANLLPSACEFSAQPRTYEVAVVDSESEWARNCWTSHTAWGALDQMRFHRRLQDLNAGRLRLTSLHLVMFGRWARTVPGWDEEDYPIRCRLVDDNE